MTGSSQIIGWVGVGADASPTTATEMAARVPGADLTTLAVERGSSYVIAATGHASRAAVARRGDLVVALHGHPYWQDAEGRQDTVPSVVADRLLDAFIVDGSQALRNLHGDFAVALLDRKRSRLIVAVDRMSIRNIVYAPVSGGVVFGPTCDAVLAHSRVSGSIDPQRLYDYVYFHMVPGPGTVYRGIRRIPPGHLVVVESTVSEPVPYWQPHFSEQEREPLPVLRRQFRGILEDSVRMLTTATSTGAFLSGGTDSSTVTGLLGRSITHAADAFSIGFAAEGFDEMGYARLAAGHFGAAHHEYYVTPEDVVTALPAIAATYDQPFGNASAVPTYYCAKLAAGHGISRMLAGDGGDELFGGNARYARQLQLALYDRIPAGIRRALLEPVAARLPLTGRVAVLRKAKSYVAQASMPMPDRYESYNLLERLGAANVFEQAFLAEIDPGGPLRQLRGIYAATDAGSVVNRMLALDFRFTLADNDLPKVTRMCELAGVDVAFPMLNDDLVEFSMRLPPREKVRGTRLRPFFKEALADFLPSETIAKEKHGFGLPVGPWLQSHAPLRTLAGDSLASLRRRRIVRGDFIDRLQGEHFAEHAGYYGTMIWVLMMLELWFQHHVDRTGRER